MSAHTPAPWQVSPPCELSSRCSVYHNGPLAYVDRIEDARLIAAAPALLEALRELSDYVFDEYSASHPLCERAAEARKLIERATGGAP